MEITIQEDSRYGLVVSSRVIAKELGKRHADVLEALEKILENGDFRSLIIPSFYRVANQKREYKEYLLTKDGFTLYMFNIQGYNDFKMAYIQKFNEMEEHIKSQYTLFKEVPKEIAEIPDEDWALDRMANLPKIIKKREKLIMALKLRNDIDLGMLKSLADFKMQTAWRNFMEFKREDTTPRNEELVKMDTYIEKEIVKALEDTDKDKILREALEEHYSK